MGLLAETDEGMYWWQSTTISGGLKYKIKIKFNIST